MTGASSSSPAHHRPWLDVVRALAALLVLLSHVRAFTLRDAAEQPPLSLLARVFFGLSGLGHQAVIVFFVLSGFLVAGSMRRLSAAGEWSLLRFGLERLTRLWPVLIPCLILGGLFDAIGLHLAADPDRYGRLALTTPLVAPSNNAGTLLGNMAFLQTIAVPVYGSNGPLWSLAAEAWFYALAALAVSAWHLRAGSAAVIPMVVLALVAAWLPTDILALFPAWLCGAAALVVEPGTRSGVKTTARRVAAIGVAFVGAAIVARLHVGLGPLAADYAVAVAAGALLQSLAVLPFPDGPALRPLLRLSTVSYTLYLSHVPLLALLSTLVIGPQRKIVGLAAVADMLVFSTAAIAWAGAVAWLFERHTPALRRLVVRSLAGRPKPVLAGFGGRGAGP